MGSFQAYIRYQCLRLNALASPPSLSNIFPPSKMKTPTLSYFFRNLVGNDVHVLGMGGIRIGN